MACVCCNKDAGYTDLPPGSRSKRWVGQPDLPMTKCNNCGAWYPQTSIDPNERKEA